MRAVIQHWLQVAGFGEKKNKVRRMKKKKTNCCHFLTVCNFRNCPLCFVLVMNFQAVKNIYITSGLVGKEFFQIYILLIW